LQGVPELNNYQGLSTYLYLSQALGPYVREHRVYVYLVTDAKMDEFQKIEIDLD